MEYQFKPGQSGNPGGRPKNRPSLRRAILEEFAELIEDPKHPGELITVANYFARKMITLALSSAADSRELLKLLEGEQPPVESEPSPDSAPPEGEVDPITEAALARLARREALASKRAASGASKPKPTRKVKPAGEDTPHD